jgi:(2Fe-2S) ferredoxin
MLAKVLVCQNVTCQQQGAADVLAVVEQMAPEDVVVEPCGCLGQCGNGPMVVICEDAARKFWYHKVQPKEAALIAQQHLKGKKPVVHKLYPLFHEPQRSIWGWAVGLFVFFGLCVGVAIAMAGRYQ